MEGRALGGGTCRKVGNETSQNEETSNKLDVNCGKMKKAEYKILKLEIFGLLFIPVDYKHEKKVPFSWETISSIT